jgi:hypothetical protein
MHSSITLAITKANPSAQDESGISAHDRLWEADLVGFRLPEMAVGEHSQQYGALWQAAIYCGLASPPSKPAGEWQHGWQPEYQNWHPESIVGTNGLSRHQKTSSSQFVARKDQAEALKGFGYTRAHAIGHPIIYVQTPAVERRGKSLLVMPVHSIATTEHDWNFDEYAETIAAIADEFEEVVACVSPSCFEKGYWVEAFRKRKIPVICGANFNDRHAYDRMAALFCRFEFTTSNGFGSHLAYAQFFGSKTSIYGPWPVSRREDYRNDPIYRNCPELLDFSFKESNHERVRRCWPWLFAHPLDGTADSGWAGQQLGRDCKRAPHELADLFGWKRRGSVSALATALNARVRGAAQVRRRIHKFVDLALSPARMREDRSLARVSSLPAGVAGNFEVCGESIQVTDGPQAAREYHVYHSELFGQVRVNPPEAPLIDLVVNDGVALALLSRSHPWRSIHVIPSQNGFGRNRHRWPTIQFLSPEYARQEVSCCAKVDWLAQHAVNHAVLRGAGIMRVALCPKCVATFSNLVPFFPKISLLLVEYAEPRLQQPDLGLLARHLADSGFQTRTSSIVYLAWGAASAMPNHHLTHVEALRYGDTQRSEIIAIPGQINVSEAAS